MSLQTDVDQLGERVNDVAGDLARHTRITDALLTALKHRVDVLEDRASGLDTGFAVEVAELKRRVSRLEGRSS